MMCAIAFEPNPVGHRIQALPRHLGRRSKSETEVGLPADPAPRNSSVADPLAPLADC